jgi:Dyp-type peroxidase family
MKHELPDIQGLILSGYGDRPIACYALFEILDAALARRWLKSVIGELQFGEYRGTKRSVAPFLKSICKNLAFTHAGLHRLGLPDVALNGFSLPFQEGMCEASRARRLGDDGGSAPESWAWGSAGQPLHGLLSVFAGDVGDPPELVRDSYTRITTYIKSTLHADFGFRLLAQLDATPSDPVYRREHFGFRDGIANPQFEGLPRYEDDDPIAEGEFVLGYPNCYGKLPMSPHVPDDVGPAELLEPAADAADRRDFGKNGSYLVFRQLRQDVCEFWRFIEQAAPRIPDAPPGALGREWLGAKLVGRWPNGTALSVSPDAPGAIAQEDEDNFLYGTTQDSFGERCPIGSHIRRTNPRDTALPVPHDPELSGDPANEADRNDRLELVNRHRILRRGRAYGPRVSHDSDPEALRTTEIAEERGLYFLCFNANLERQFEFVQSNWVLNPAFAGLSADPDPLLAADRAFPYRASSFTIQGCPTRRVHGLPRVVETRGGAYFFMPGRRALEYLAALGL